MSMVFPLSFAQIAFSGFQSSEVFCLNFCLGRPFGFSTQQSFSFLFFSFLFQTLYFQSLSMLIQQSISSPSKYIILVAPPDMIFLVINGPDHLGFIFPLRSKVSSLSTFRTKSHSLSFLGFTFLLNALAILFWYPCAWYYALAFFSSTKPIAHILPSSSLLLRPWFPLALSKIVSPPQLEALLHYHRPKSKVLPQLMHGQKFCNLIKQMEVSRPNPCMSLPFWLGCS